MFEKGNKYGKGNPHAKRVQMLRSAFLQCATEADVQDLYDMLLYKALNDHDVIAARELLDRLIGKSKETYDISLIGDEGPARTLDLSKLSENDLEIIKQLAIKAGSGKGTTDLLEHTHSLPNEPRFVPSQEVANGK